MKCAFVRKIYWYTELCVRVWS